MILCVFKELKWSTTVQQNTQFISVLSILSFMLKQNLLARERGHNYHIKMDAVIGNWYMLLSTSALPKDEEIRLRDFRQRACIHTTTRKEWQSWVSISVSRSHIFLRKQTKTSLLIICSTCCYHFLTLLILYYNKVMMWIAGEWEALREQGMESRKGRKPPGEQLGMSFPWPSYSASDFSQFLFLCFFSFVFFM